MKNLLKEIIITAIIISSCIIALLLCNVKVEDTILASYILGISYLFIRTPIILKAS